MLFGYDKEHFITLPTPIQHLPAISAMTGCEFYIKRDDMTDLGMGGNKLRKLEYLLWDAKRQGATLLLTYGGAQTNHGRLTAAVAAKYGMKCAILCLDDHPEGINANILLDRIMGAEVWVKPSDGSDEGEQNRLFGQQVREQAALALEHHVAPTTAITACRVGVCRHAAQAQQPQNQPLAQKSLVHVCAPQLYFGEKRFSSFGET